MTKSKLTEAEAVAAVEKLANDLRGPNKNSGPLLVVPSSVRRLKRAWLMCVQSRRFLETRDRRYLVMGTPCFVVQHDGQIIRHPPQQRTEDFIKRWL